MGKEEPTWLMTGQTETSIVGLCWIDMRTQFNPGSLDAASSFLLRKSQTPRISFLQCDKGQSAVPVCMRGKGERQQGESPFHRWLVSR